MCIINPLVLGALTPAIIANRATWSSWWTTNSSLLSAYDTTVESANLARPMPHKPLSFNSLTPSLELLPALDKPRYIPKFG